MDERTTFMALPPELRERVYEYVALRHTTRRVREVYIEDSSLAEYKTTTSAITAACHLIHQEYEAVARKLVTAIEFTVTDLDFTPVIDYFHGQVNAKFLATLQQNKATIHVDLVVCNPRKFDLPEFYAWALFLIDIGLEPAYHSDPSTWMSIFETMVFEDLEDDLTERCRVDNKKGDELIRDNEREIRNVAIAFDDTMWLAYPTFSQELQAKRHRESGHGCMMDVCRGPQ